MMEKFDGVRVYWDGKHLLTSKDKERIDIPKELSITFPTFAFEGELW
jgi:hypothetical protein